MDETKTDAIPIARLTRDLRKAGTKLGPRQARFLVDAYYMLQDNRIRADHQVRTLAKAEEPNELIAWLGEQNLALEKDLKLSLDVYSLSRPEGRWARGICGVGPVIGAGLLAHIDINKAPTVGHIWRFAGLDPTMEWKSGEQRPWNAKLKALVAYKLGESFVKVKNNPSDYYGKIYDTRKKLEWKRNFEGRNAEACEVSLKKYNFKDNNVRKFYEGKYSMSVVKGMVEEGTPIPMDFKPKETPVGDELPMLPPVHIHRRATRYAVKLFLAHYHEITFWYTFGKAPPLPYPIVHLEGHNDVIAPPNMPEEFLAA